MSRVRVATWNLHGGRGLDGRIRPERIADVVAELDADVVALQEVRSGARFDLCAALTRSGDYRIELHRTYERAGETFGNAILSRWPLVACERHDLAVAGREPRAALDATILAGDFRLRVVATHLGLSARERRVQVRKIKAIAGASDADAFVLAGDFNAFTGAETRVLDGELGASPAPRTFPSPLPFLALDRIWTLPRAVLERVDVHRSRRARIASDHLPLVATLDLAASTGPLSTR